jgi:hypothetical protein
MADIKGFHVDELEFTKDGEAADAARVAAFIESVEQRAPADLLVLSHGWNNDIAQARDLYKAWLGVVREAGKRQGWTADNRRIDVLAVLWPSKQFAEDELIAGGAAGVQFAADPNDTAALVAQLEALDGILSDSQIDDLRTLVPKLSSDRAARDQFVKITVSAFEDAPADDPDAGNEEPPALAAASSDGTLLATFQADPTDADAGPTNEGGAAVVGGGAATDDGGAAGLGDFLHGAVGGARNLLNFLTYYKMKNRAGLVGRRGVAPILAQVAALPNAPRIHLVGHSFGARVVTSAVLGPEGGANNHVNTLVLAQAAFSHNAFAKDFDGPRDGFFRAVVESRCVTGPIVITHTANDRAVGIAYALASRVAGQDASAIGGPSDRFGGLGRNGAMNTGAFKGEMLDVGKDYVGLDKNAVYNLLADKFISSHSDVRGKQVGEVIVQAIAAS